MINVVSAWPGLAFRVTITAASTRIQGPHADGVWQFQNLLDTALQITGSGQYEARVLYVAGVTGQRETDTGSVWRLVSADQIPEGATTIPLGEPGGGEAAVDEFGAPIDEATDESDDAGETAEPGRDRDISVDVPPGETGEPIITLPPGTYRFICMVPGHG